ncbi:hypothetical protein GCM10009837_12480 [Streptomyces durmitorensis]
MGAVVGALAAIGGLVFTAVATYYSAAVAEDQLQQSREVAEKEARDQASRVSLWAVGFQHTEVHVLNRSQDPLTATRLFGEVDFVEPPNLTKPLTAQLYVDLFNMAPCTEVILRPNRWVVMTSDGERLDMKKARGLISYMALELIDRDGQSWLRTNGGLYKTAELRQPELKRPGAWSSYLATPVVKPAASCGD